MSDSREEIAQAIRESQSDDYREEGATDMDYRDMTIGKRNAGGFREITVDGVKVGTISRYSDGTWVGFPILTGPTGSRVFFGSVGMQRAAELLAEVHSDRARELAAADDSQIRESAPAEVATQALRDLYDIVRELADADIIDPDEIGESDADLAERFAIAIRSAESVLVDTVGPQSVK